MTVPGAEIRPASSADVAALAELESLLFGPDAWSPAQVLDEVDGAHRRAWVAEMNARTFISGYCFTMTLGEVADLQRIGVHPERQRTGLARELLETAVAAARGDGAERMLLEVSAENSAALAFYAATGFTEIDRRARYYKDGSDAVVMMRRLEED
jgi:ribosomal-protein-alanine N-acetyltransferase